MKRFQVIVQAEYTEDPVLSIDKILRKFKAVLEDCRYENVAFSEVVEYDFTTEGQ